MAYELVIRGGTVYDGSGGSPFRADVAVAKGRIAAIGPKLGEAEREIDATGLAVTPGFIDIHSHSDYTLLVDPRAVSSISQGVTTEIIGNCGFGCAPVGDPRLARDSIYGFDGSVALSWHSIGGYLDKLDAARPAVNVMTLYPNAQLRRIAVGDPENPASPAELDRMRGMVREGLAEGAAGFSIGLEYPAEAAASENELTALAAEAGRVGKLFATHTRDRAEGAVEAVAEVLRIARRAEVRLQVSHLLPRCGHEGSLRCVEIVDEARACGQDVAFDMHTRLYGTTMLSTLLPPWALKDGPQALRRHLADPGQRERIRNGRGIILSVGDWDKVILLDVPGRPDISRRTLGDIGRERQRDPHDCALDILSDEAEELHRPMVLLAVYDDDIQKLAFGHDLCSPASDATALAPDGPLSGSSFHGAYTWAAWFWRRVVREWRLLTPQEGVRRLTAHQARILGLHDRGALVAGARADIAVFEPETFGERGTIFEPNQIAAGMRHVVVNGVPALADGVLTGQRAGQVLRMRN
jgi:N-acyl-D-aspartate/D-glutamate deacylase